MTDYSDQSADTICQVCLEGPQKVIYLTFDDGPEPGTLEVYEALKSQSVPATFFFVGENVVALEDGTFERKFPSWNLKPGLFKRIFDDPLFQIGSHSQTQSHQFYDSYYDSGLRIDVDTLQPSATSKKAGRRSVLVDFELSSMAFSYALTGKPLQYMPEMKKIKNYGYRGSSVAKVFSEEKVQSYFRFCTARLPGTNIWRLPKRKTSYQYGFGGRDDEADDLSSNGYRLYGWDLEWHFSRPDSKSDMSEDVHKEYERVNVLSSDSASSTSGTKAGTDGKADKKDDGNGDESKSDGWWDYFGANIGKDRPKQSAAQMLKETSSFLDSMLDKTRFESDAQVVILMHDRLFRPAEKADLYTSILLDYVNLCKAKGYRFDVLENYRP